MGERVEGVNIEVDIDRSDILMEGLGGGGVGGRLSCQP